MAVLQASATTQRWRLLGSASGIACIVSEAIALAVVSSSLPSSGKSAPALWQFVVMHQAGLRAYSLLAGLASVFLLWYAVALGNFLRQQEDGGWLASLAMAGGSAQAVLHWISATALLLFPTAVISWSDVDLRVPVAWLTVYLTFLAYPAIVFAGAAGLRVIQTGLLPPWLGWAGIAVAIAELATVVGASLTANGPLASGGAFGFASFGLWMIWVLVTSIALTRHILAEGAGRL
jgi:hypothetical protein